ncbi:type II secretion system F family protein [Halolamina rubra]|uniref:type II secretion system F family protein n=1 Tax=Halolamina rubra TaxID=1380430 RepID=UPI0006795A75|nr:type II secretion system F family protein [Halolamina rubra]
MTGLYAFGVLLPLALVGVLPAARLAGVNVGIVALSALYNLLLPVGLLGASGWLLAERPVSFPPPRIGPSHPEVPDRRRSAALLGVLAGGVTGFGAALLLPWAVPIVAVGAGGGAALLRLFAPVRELRREVREIESGLPDALALVGRRVDDGVAVERALEAAAAELTGETGELLDRATRRSSQLGLPVGESFFGRFGVLRTVPGSRLRDAGQLFALAATEGPPAGDALVAAGDHLRELARVERDARRELAAITGTLSNTAALFGPLVGGVSVAMVGRIPADAAGSLNGGAASTASAASAAPLGPGTLGPVVGVYVLLLAAILTGLATALERGLDPSLLGYRIGLALPTATAAYVAALVAAEAAL